MLCSRPATMSPRQHMQGRPCPPPGSSAPQLLLQPARQRQLHVAAALVDAPQRQLRQQLQAQHRTRVRCSWTCLLPAALRRASARRGRAAAAVSPAAQWGAEVQFSPARIVSNAPAASGLHVLTLDVPTDIAAGYARAGQYVQLRMGDNKPGYFAIATPPEAVGGTGKGGRAWEFLVKRQGAPGGTADLLCASAAGAEVRHSTGISTTPVVARSAHGQGGLWNPDKPEHSHSVFLRRRRPSARQDVRSLHAGIASHYSLQALTPPVQGGLHVPLPWFFCCLHAAATVACRSRIP